MGEILKQFRKPKRIKRLNLKEVEYKKKSTDDIKKDWRKYCEHWKWYPDHFIDFISGDNCKIKLHFYQRIFLRVFFRYRKVFITATRGTAKTWTEILAIYLQCMFYPGIAKFICAPGKEQAAKMSQENLDAILEFFPILEGELRYKSFSKDYTKLVFKNGSRFDVVQVKDSQKGGRRHGGSIEEIADPLFDGDKLHSVVIPLMANNRIASCGGVDPEEIHKQEFYITTAGTRQSFAFTKMQEVLLDMPNGESFALGSGFELPCMEDQLDIDFVNEQKESPSFNPLSFQREYESIWTGSSNNSLVSLEDLNKCRILSESEDKSVDKDAEYVLSYDVARAEGSANAQSALVVIKIKERGDGTYSKHLVNIYSFEGTHFLEQAQFLKRKVNEYRAVILCVDGNGLGAGLIDYLVTEVDENPAYEVVNDDRFDRYKTTSSIPMVFNIKSSTKETNASDIHNVFMSDIANQRVKLLRPESAMKAKMFETNSNLTSEKYVQQSYAFLMTDLLCDEIMNLEYRQSGTSTKVTQVSAAVNKDKFSALEYGLFWIYLQEKGNRIKRDTNFDWGAFALW